MWIDHHVPWLKYTSFALFASASVICVPQVADARCVALGKDVGWAALYATGGMYGFKLTKAAGVELPIGRLFRLSASGQEEPIWERTLVSIPGAVFISNDLGTVATVKTGPCESGGKHALVLYGADGRVVANHAFDDIVPEKQWAGKVAVTHDGIRWVEGTQFTFDSSPSLENYFVITFPSRIQIRIDRTTGHVVAGEGVEVKPSPR